MALTTEGSSQTFNYTGGIQNLAITRKGIYKLEVWGGRTYVTSLNNNPSLTAKGGYASGYKKLTSGTLYIVCGNQVITGGYGESSPGGYNGGGSGYGYYNDNGYGRFYCQGGAGATHIASVSGLLKNVNISNVYIVAGGAGGCSSGITSGSVRNAYAGTDGGTTTKNNAIQGQGDSRTSSQGSGGGGGYRGGTASSATGANTPLGGGGGSNYIGNVPSFTFDGVTYAPSSSSGNRNGAGQAKITLTKIIWDVNITKNINAAGTISGGGEVANGDSITITATVNSGYSFLGWYKGDTRISTSLSYTFTPSADITLTAKYVARYALELNVSPSGSGTVTGSGTYDSGTSVLIEATRNSGYLFYGWYSGDTLISNESSYQFNIFANLTYIARFATSYIVTTSINLPGAGTITGSGEYISGTRVNLSVQAVNPGYIFTGWYSNDTLVTADRSYSFTINDDITYEARFIASQISVSIRTGGTCSYNPEVNPVVFTATPSEHYRFTKYVIETSDGYMAEYATNPLTYTVPGDVDWVVCNVVFTYEFDWESPITDRTQEDVINKTEKAHLNTSDLNRIEKDIGYLQDKWALPLNIKTDWSITNVICQSDFTRILNNLTILSTYCEDELIIPNHPINTWEKLNSLESAIDLLYNNVD